MSIKKLQTFRWITLTIFVCRSTRAWLLSQSLLIPCWKVRLKFFSKDNCFATKLFLLSFLCQESYFFVSGCNSNRDNWSALIEKKEKDDSEKDSWWPRRKEILKESSIFRIVAFLGALTILFRALWSVDIWFQVNKWITDAPQKEKVIPSRNWKMKIWNLKSWFVICHTLWWKTETCCCYLNFIFRCNLFDFYLAIIFIYLTSYFGQILWFSSILRLAFSGE